MNYKAIKMENNQTHLIVSHSDLNEVKKQLKEVITLLSKNKVGEKIKEEFISEADARKLFVRSSTWFWHQRKAGKVKSHKVGKTVYYRREDLLRLFNEDNLTNEETE